MGRPRSLRTRKPVTRNWQDLVVANRPFAVHIARKTALWSAVPLEDLISAAYEGLVIAARRFDPKLGLKFTTYAAGWIHRVIRDDYQLSSTVRIPQRTQLRRARAGKARFNPVCSIETPIGTTQRIEDTLRSNGEGPHDLVERELTVALVRRNLEALPERHAEILRLRFGFQDLEPLKLQEIGEIFRLSRERIRQLEVEALTMLRKRMRVAA